MIENNIDSILHRLNNRIGTIISFYEPLTTFEIETLKNHGIDVNERMSQQNRMFEYTISYYVNINDIIHLKYINELTNNLVDAFDNNEPDKIVKLVEQYKRMK